MSTGYSYHIKKSIPSIARSTVSSKQPVESFPKSYVCRQRYPPERHDFSLVGSLRCNRGNVSTQVSFTLRNDTKLCTGIHRNVQVWISVSRTRQTYVQAPVLNRRDQLGGYNSFSLFLIVHLSKAHI